MLDNGDLKKKNRGRSGVVYVCTAKRKGSLFVLGAGKIRNSRSLVNIVRKPSLGTTTTTKTAGYSHLSSTCVTLALGTGGPHLFFFFRHE